jgi:hypothetical protein
VLFLAAFAFLDCLSEDVFDLTVQAAQFVLRPGFQFSQELTVSTKQKGLSAHQTDQLAVERTCVQHRMDFRFAAKHNHKIADHSGLTLIVKD